MTMILEAVRSLRATPMVNFMTLLVAAVAAVVVLLATTEAISSEHRALAAIDAPTSRVMMLVDTERQAELEPDAVRRIAALSTVEWAFGLGPARDLRTPDPNSIRVIPLRNIFGELPSQLVSHPDLEPDEAMVGVAAAEFSGLNRGIGGLLGEQRSYSAVGTFTALEPIAFLTSSALSQWNGEPSQQPVRIVFLVKNIAATAPTAIASVQAAGARQPLALSVEMPEDLQELRSALQGELADGARSLAVIVISSSAALMCLFTSVIVVLRRQDLGRRRALGASRLMILSLVVSQTTVLGAVGALLGAVTTLAVQVAGEQQLTTFAYPTAVVVLLILSSAAGAIPPAVFASNRDPIRVLRVP